MVINQIAVTHLRKTHAFARVAHIGWPVVSLDLARSERPRIAAPISDYSAYPIDHEAREGDPRDPRHDLRHDVSRSQHWTILIRGSWR